MRKRLRRRQLGQSLTEYVMLMVFVAVCGKFLLNAMPDLFRRVQAPFKDQYAKAYKNGRPDACGVDNDPDSCGGSPANHPKYPDSGVRTRMFARRE